MSGNTLKQNLHSLKDKNGNLTNFPQETLKLLSDELIPSDGTPAPALQHEPDAELIPKITAPDRLNSCAAGIKLDRNQLETDSLNDYSSQ